MPVTELNHYLIRANNLERTKDFYCKVLGFELCRGRTFRSQAYWLASTARSRCIWRRPACRTRSSTTSAARERGPGQFRRGRPYRFPRNGTRPAGEAPEGAQGRLPPRNFPESQLYQLFIKDPTASPSSSISSASPRRPTGAARTTRRCRAMKASKKKTAKAKVAA